ncbi:MAG: NAD(P)/FAD-dependent oxidoreductase [Halobacteriaceae archaeon]
MTHVVVVGAYGSAGVAAAQRLADAPEVDRLTLVDDGDPGGGLCILRGCMPSKEVLSAAAHRHHPRADERLDGPAPAVDLERTVAVKDRHTGNFAKHRRAAVHDLSERADVTLHRDTARFVDDRTVAVGGRTIDADYVVLATGSSVNRPDIDGIETVDPMDSADVLDATSLPDSGVVMGFGYVGIELVPYLREAGGVDLTVIEHDERPLDRAHPSIGDDLLALYREEFGIEVLTETTEKAVEPTDDGGVRLHVAGPNGDRSIEADQLFIFTGRRPALDGPGLDATSLDPGPGWVDDAMRAAGDPRVYVPGDANGDRMVLHVAKEEGVLAAENIRADCRGDAVETYDPTTHRVMFAGAGVYPYASVGMTAEEARAAGHEPVVTTREASDDGVFKSKAVPRGRARLVVDPDGTVLGYHGLHFHADVMAKTMQVIVENEMDVGAVPDRAYHPTTPEIIDGLVRAAAEQVD